MNQRARSAHGEVHAPAALEVRDEAVDGGGVEGVSADEQRMEAQRDPQLRVPDIGRHEPVDAAMPTQLQEIRCHVDHGLERGEGLVAEFLEAEAADLSAPRHEASVSVQIRRRHPHHLFLHQRLIGVTGDHLPVVEDQPVEGIHGAKVDIVRKPSPAKGPEIFEQIGCRDDRRTGVKGEAVAPVHIGPTARCVETLQHGDPIALGAQPDRSRQPPEAAADDHGMRPRVRTGCAQSFSAIKCQHG